MQNKFRHDRFCKDSIALSLVDDVPILKNKMLSSPFGVIHKPLKAWARKLNGAIHETSFSSQETMGKIADLFQQAMEIFMGLNQMQQAKEICYTQLQLFIDHSKKYPDWHAENYLWDSWVNLIRIDRKEGNIYDAFEKIKKLNIENLLIPSLHLSLNHDAILREKIIAKGMMEKIKLHLVAGQYNKILKFYNDNKIYLPASYESMMAEAQLIAMVNLGKKEMASQFLEKNRGKYEILAFREYEMQQNFQQCDTNILSLITESAQLDREKIICLLSLIPLLKRAGHEEKVQQVASCCLHSTRLLEDELLIGESLMALYRIGNVNDDLKNAIISHYADTQYEMIRRKMLACCPELQRNKCKHDDEEIVFLYENILSFHW